MSGSLEKRSIKNGQTEGTRTGIKVLLLGATGLVGRNVLQLALRDQRVWQIIAPTRHRLGPHSKLFNPVAQELATLVEEAAAHSIDSMISAVGGNNRQAWIQASLLSGRLRASDDICQSRVSGKRSCMRFRLVS